MGEGGKGEDPSDPSGQGAPGGGRAEIPVIRPGEVRQVGVAPLPDGRLQLWAVSEAGKLFRTRKRDPHDPDAGWEDWEDILKKVPAGT
jgi:hypothetical protein